MALIETTNFNLNYTSIDLHQWSSRAYWIWIKKSSDFYWKLKYEIKNFNQTGGRWGDDKINIIHYPVDLLNVNWKVQWFLLKAKVKLLKYEIKNILTKQVD